MTTPPRSRHRSPRPYLRSGLHVVTRALPYLLDRVTDPAVSDSELSPVERAARDWRADVLADLGGPEAVPAAKLALLDAALGTKIILDSVDRYVFELAAAGGLVSRRTRTAFRVVADRMRVADGLARQLQALGLERRDRPPLDLGAYLRSRPGRESDPGASSLSSPSSPAAPDAASRDGGDYAPVAEPPSDGRPGDDRGIL